MKDYEKEYNDAMARLELVVRTGMKLDPAYIFPELRESEDERIRKWIANYIHRGVFDEEEHPMALKAVEWLEKQKEPENVSATTMAPSCWAEEPSLQKEQKPVEPTGKLSREEYLYQLLIDQLITYSDYEYLTGKKPAEWSEEDKKMRDLIVAIFEVNHPDGFFKANELGTTDMRGVHTEEIISWLKSLRPQKLDASKLENFDPVDVLNRIKTEWPMAWEKVVGKQEWSEVNNGPLIELRKIYIELLNYPDKKKPFITQNELTRRLIRLDEKLEPHHSTWKPSEEQMDSLRDTIVQTKGYSYSIYLPELYEQLKKLI